MSQLRFLPRNGCSVEGHGFDLAFRQLVLAINGEFIGVYVCTCMPVCVLAHMLTFKVLKDF